MRSAIVEEISKQYSLKKILTLWCLSALPMAMFAFVITPQVISATLCDPLIVYWMAVIIGLIWQFILSLLVLKSDGFAISLHTIAIRMRYQKPINPKTGSSSYWLLLWTLPFILVSVLLQSGVIHVPNVDGALTSMIERLPKYDLSSLSALEYKGKWWLMILFLVTFIFNYFLGEEFFYRGILLPNMNGVFGKWDWFANGVLFGFYHLHKPQIIFSTAIYFGFVFAFPAKLFQSSWMAVIIHGMEGLLGITLVLAVILGYG